MRCCALLLLTIPVRAGAWPTWIRVTGATGANAANINGYYLWDGATLVQDNPLWVKDDGDNETAWAIQYFAGNRSSSWLITNAATREQELDDCIAWRRASADDPTKESGPWTVATGPAAGEKQALLLAEAQWPSQIRVSNATGGAAAALLEGDYSQAAALNGRPRWLRQRDQESTEEYNSALWFHPGDPPQWVFACEAYGSSEYSLDSWVVQRAVTEADPVSEAVLDGWLASAGTWGELPQPGLVIQAVAFQVQSTTPRPSSSAGTAIGLIIGALVVCGVCGFIVYTRSPELRRRGAELRKRGSALQRRGSALYRRGRRAVRQLLTPMTSPAPTPTVKIHPTPAPGRPSPTPSPGPAGPHVAPGPATPTEEPDPPPASPRKIVVARGEAPPIPEYWKNRDAAATFEDWVELPKEDMDVISALMKSTWTGRRTRDRSGEMPVGMQLVKGFRVENSELWRRYADAHMRISRLRPRISPVEEVLGKGLRTESRWSERLVREVNEAYVWHGTTPTGATGISKGGFRLDLAGSRAGTMFGKGVYLAECTSKSDEYAGDDQTGPYKGVYCMLMCRAVLGEPLRLTAGGRSVHKQIEDAVASKACDSVVGDREACVGTYREFIVYEAGQAYPEYVILYTREYEAKATE